MHGDIEALESQLEGLGREAETLVQGVEEAAGQWSPTPGVWSVAECLDHLGVTNGVYLAPMREAAAKARGRGRLRRGPAEPGLVGSWFLKQIEPPVKARTRFKATANIRPRSGTTLAEALRSFAGSQQQVLAFLRENADLDLAGVKFRNPILRGLRFSLASGLHIIAAHERRHLWQAREVLHRYEGQGAARAGNAMQR